MGELRATQLKHKEALGQALGKEKEAKAKALAKVRQIQPGWLSC